GLPRLLADLADHVPEPSLLQSFLCLRVLLLRLDQARRGALQLRRDGIAVSAQYFERFAQAVLVVLAHALQDLVANRASLLLQPLQPALNRGAPLEQLGDLRPASVVVACHPLYLPSGAGLRRRRSCSPAHPRKRSITESSMPPAPPDLPCPARSGWYSHRPRLRS